MPAPTPLSAFQYTSVQTHTTLIGKKLRTKTRRVKIRNGKGFKEVVTTHPTRRSRRALTKKEVRGIQRCQFIPGLFKTCEKCIQ
jgi:hypothetical protein